MGNKETIFIEVYGNTDYGALIFENLRMGINDIYKRMIDEDVTKLKIEVDYFDSKEVLTFVMHKFGQVDPAFEKFVLDEFCDYDTLKHRMIYRLDQK